MEGITSEKRFVKQETGRKRTTGQKANRASKVQWRIQDPQEDKSKPHKQGGFRNEGIAQEDFQH